MFRFTLCDALVYSFFLSLPADGKTFDSNDMEKKQKKKAVLLLTTGHNDFLIFFSSFFLLSFLSSLLSFFFECNIRKSMNPFRMNTRYILSFSKRHELISMVG